jgi:hypothetical protein
MKGPDQRGRCREHSVGLQSSHPFILSLRLGGYATGMMIIAAGVGTGSLIVVAHSRALAPRRSGDTMTTYQRASEAEEQARTSRPGRIRSARRILAIALLWRRTLPDLEKPTQQPGIDATRATAGLPGLDIEIVHRWSPGGDAEQISINLQAVPSFKAFGRFYRRDGKLVGALSPTKRRTGS